MEWNRAKSSSPRGNGMKCLHSKDIGATILFLLMLNDITTFLALSQAMPNPFVQGFSEWT